jgi:hypothetical protein
MPVVDADTHVDESEETWEFLDEADRRFRPVTTVQEMPEAAPGTRRGYHRYWVIDSQLRVRRVRDDKRTGTTLETRELRNVPARLSHMDELGVDIHVMYPTLFLDALTVHPEVELALYKAYNRWMADRWRQSHNRLRWVAMAPLFSMDKALEEMHFAKANGACGIFKKGVECGNRRASDPYFFPLYGEAQQLGLPICIHTGRGFPEFSAANPDSLGLWHSLLPVLDAFHALVTLGVPAKFPDLRFGFIEATAGWIPFLITYLRAHRQRLAWAEHFTLERDLLRDCRFYVACQTQDDLPYILDMVGEDNLVIGSDYTHADASAELEALRILRERKDIGPAVAKKILDDNARALYGL